MEDNGIIKWNKTKNNFTSKLLRNEKNAPSTMMTRLKRHAKLTCNPRLLFGHISPASCNKDSNRVVHHGQKAESSSLSLLPPSPVPPHWWKREWPSLPVCHGHQHVRTGQWRRNWKLTHPVPLKCNQIAISGAFLGRLWLFCISNTSSHLWGWAALTQWLNTVWKSTQNTIWSTNAADLC